MDPTWLSPPTGHLTVVTDDLQANAAFLVARSLQAALKSPSQPRRVVFLSTTNTIDYWKAILSKAVYVAL